MKFIGNNSTVLALCFVLFSGLTWSQEALEVSVNRNPVRTGEQIQLTFTLKNINRKIDAPKINGLKFLGGPSTSNSTSWVNGSRSSESSYTYTYQVTSKSDITVPSYELKGSQGILKSTPFDIRVLERSQMKQGENTGDLGTVACIIETSSRNVHVGEPIVVSFKIFNRANNLDVRKFNIPETPGFWKETVETPDPRWEPQIIAGKRYNVANVQTLVLFPQQTGTLTIEGFDLIGYMRTSFFDGQNVTASADPVKISVSPLPEPIPTPYLGSFGQLRVNAQQSEGACKTNEAITLDVTFNGEGNLKFIQEPELVWPGEFEIFDPEVIDRIKVTEKGESGSRTFRYVVIPRAPGNYTLPMPMGKWFNWRTDQYSDLTSPALKLEVTRNESDEGGQINYNSKIDVQVLNQDIQYIHTEWSGPCLPKTRTNHRGRDAAGLLAMGPMVLGASMLLRRRRERDQLDPKGARKRRARHKVRKALQEAKQLTNDPAAFYPALGAALENYLLAKLEWNASQLQREALVEALHSHVPGLHQRWSELLQALDMARYAPGQVEEPASMLATSEALINETEKTWNA
jgi:hypothetical protein